MSEDLIFAVLISLIFGIGVGLILAYCAHCEAREEIDKYNAETTPKEGA